MFSLASGLDNEKVWVMSKIRRGAIAYLYGNRDVISTIFYLEYVTHLKDKFPGAYKRWFV